MNQKAHIVGGIFLATAVMIGEVPPFTASLTVFGTMFCDLDRFSRHHRKLFHNIFVVLVFLGLALKFPPSFYWALGVLLHDVMDMFSSAPVYLFWPVPREGEHIEVGGWGVANKSMLSFPVGVLSAVVFSTGYLVLTGHLGDAIALLKKILDLIS